LTREIWVKVVSREVMEAIAALPDPVAFEELIARRFREAPPLDDHDVIQVKVVKVVDVLAEFKRQQGLFQAG
jgi:hypothetical protein